MARASESAKQKAAPRVAAKTTTKSTTNKTSRAVRTKKPATTPKVNIPWNFPRHTLEEALSVIQGIEEKYAGNPTQAEDVARLAGYNQPDWRFLGLLRSCNLYGLATGSGAKATVTLTPLAADILSPSSSKERREALLAAFHSVDQFKQVAEFYREKKIPEDEYFANTLIRQFNVPREQVDTFIQVYSANLLFLRDYGIPPVSFGETVDISKLPDSAIILADQEHRSQREFLESCFIIMPFGEWYDKYYEEIYVPATKDAGFDPVRADSIFTTGSVTEQIWDQIKKAKVLLADLTGKNPNVFYELGLAHAVPKPVVLLAGNLEDVPFDLRHLRTIIYEVREPEWATKLRKSITAYLKSAKQEPEKTIPQTFRDGFNESKIEVED